MSIFIEKDGKKMLSPSVYVKLLVFLGLVTLSIIVMQPIQSVISSAVLNIRDNFIGKIEDFTGMEVRYSSLRPSFFGSFDIRNIRFHKGNDTVFNIYRVRVKFSIFDFLFNRKAFIHTVQIERPSLRLDLERDRETLNFLSSLVKEKNETDEKPDAGDSLRMAADFLPENAEYRIWNCFLQITDGNNEYMIDDMNLHLLGSDGKIIVDGKFAAEYRQTGLFDKAFILRTDVGVSGEFSDNLQNGNAKFSILSLSGSEQNMPRKNGSFFRIPVTVSNRPRTLFTMNPVNIAFSYNEQAVTVNHPASERIPVDFLFNYNIESGGVSASADFDDFRPGNIISFSDRFKNAEHLLLMSISGSSSFNREDGAGTDYRVNLRGGNPARSYNSLSDGFLINLYGDERRIVVNDLLFSMSPASAKAGLFQGNFGGSGNIVFAPFKPSGAFFFDRFSPNGSENINAVFNVSTGGKDVLIAGENITIAQAEIDMFEIAVYPSEKDIGIAVSGFFNEVGAVFLDAVIDKNPGRLEASLALVSVSLFELTEIYHPFSSFVNTHLVKGTLKNTVIDTEIFITTDFENIVYNAPNIMIKAGDRNGKLSLSGTDRQFKLSDGVFNIGGDELHLSADMNFADSMDLVFSINAGYMDMSWNVEGQILDRTTLIIQDSNGFHVYGNISNTGAVSGYFEGIDYPVLVNYRPVNLNFYGTMRYNSMNFWNFDIDHFIARNPAVPEDTGFLTIKGSADQDGASFRNISYRDPIGSLSGSADFKWDSNFSNLEFLAGVTDGLEDGENYFFDGTVKDSHIEVKASVSQMRFDRFINGNSPMLITGTAGLSWDSIDSFNARLNLLSFYTLLQDKYLHASVDVDFNNDELLVSDLRVDYAGMKIVLSQMQLNRAEGIAVAAADIQGNTLVGKAIEGEMDFYANFGETDSWMDIGRAFDEFDGTLLVDNIKYGDLKQDQFLFVFSGSDGSLSLSGGIRNMLRLDMDPQGNFFAGLSAPMPIRGSIIGTYKNGIIDSHCNRFFIDMRSLWNLSSNTRDFNVAGGYITGEIDIRGPLFNPEFYGEARGSSFRFQVPGYVSEDIKPVPFGIKAEGYEMAFGPADIVSGKGGGDVSGWFVFENWAPKNIGLDINIQREKPIGYDFNITGFLANGKASGNLGINIDIGNNVLELTGRLFANDTEMSLNMGEILDNSETSSAGGGVFDSIVDLTVVTGPMVEFLWPDANNPILRANPELGSTIHVFSDTQADQFSIKSDINIRSGELYYLDRNFFIRQGNIVFMEDDNQIDPRLSVRAEVRDRTDSGPVTISMIVDNQPLSGFEPRFETNPSLSQLEIYSILGQNFNSIQGYDNAEATQRFMLDSATDIVAQVIASSDTFSQFMFMRQVERQVRNFFGVDMFSIRTRFLQNIVASGVSGVSGFGGVPDNNRVGNYFDNTTVFIGKYVGQNMFIQGMVTMKYDENNSLNGGLTFQPDIGIELQSPFVNIRWSLYPAHPENYWVSDNSFTLSWSKTF